MRSNVISSSVAIYSTKNNEIANYLRLISIRRNEIISICPHRYRYRYIFPDSTWGIFFLTVGNFFWLYCFVVCFASIFSARFLWQANFKWSLLSPNDFTYSLSCVFWKFLLQFFIKTRVYERNIGKISFYFNCAIGTALTNYRDSLYC